MHNLEVKCNDVTNKCITHQNICVGCEMISAKHGLCFLVNAQIKFILSRLSIDYVYDNSTAHV